MESHPITQHNVIDTDARFSFKDSTGDLVSSQGASSNCCALIQSKEAIALPLGYSGGPVRIRASIYVNSVVQASLGNETVIEALPCASGNTIAWEALFLAPGDRVTVQLYTPNVPGPPATTTPFVFYSCATTILAWTTQ